MKQGKISVSDIYTSGEQLLISFWLLSLATYSTQGVAIPNLPVTTQICVECVFAINAPAQGCFVLFSNSPSLTFNITILRNSSTSNAPSCIPIPDSLLGQTTQEFLVSVYDYESDAELNLSEPAIILSQLLQVEPVIDIPTVSSSSSNPEPSTSFSSK